MAAVIPSLVLVFAVVVAAVPWGLPGPATFVLPLLLIVLVFVFSVRRRGSIPAWCAFVAGLAMDTLTAGPLGYWAFVFLLTHTLARLSRPRRSVPGIGGLWFAFTATAALACIAGWAVASLYFVNFIDWQPMAIGAAAAVLLFPIIAWPMRRTLGVARRPSFARRP